MEYVSCKEYKNLQESYKDLINYLETLKYIASELQEEINDKNEIDILESQFLTMNTWDFVSRDVSTLHSLFTTFINLSICKTIYCNNFYEYTVKLNELSDRITDVVISLEGYQFTDLTGERSKVLKRVLKMTKDYRNSLKSRLFMGAILDYKNHIESIGGDINIFNEHAMKL